ncbi:MAG: right-handed parallel beta-helix repeat-containing protein, partial [Actinomycetota bacterium]|nr:right-handed parallel beta-helix repeat-containing protein [Actinomycetota bacterium]
MNGNRLRLIGAIAAITILLVLVVSGLSVGNRVKNCHATHTCTSPSPTVTQTPSPSSQPGDYGPQTSISCPAGAVDISASQDIAAVVSSHVAGTAFCVLAATFHPTSPINMKAGDSLTGQYGAVIDGTNVTQGYDVGSTAIIRGWNCFTTAPCNNVTIRNLVIRNLATHDCIGIYEDGSVLPGTGWTVDHNETSGCTMGIATWSNGTFSHNFTHDNACGIGGYRNSYVVADHNEIAHNQNSGCKWAAGDHITVTNNYVHDNAYTGPELNAGIWLDTVGPGNLISGNTVQNQAFGIMYEATDAGRITANTV